MAFRWGRKSMGKLDGAHPDLAYVFSRALSFGLIDMTVIESIRSKEKQNEYFDSGKSRVQWPNGKHNIKTDNDVSMAVDVAPIINGRISWKKEHCIFMAGIIMTCAILLDKPIKWGGNWDMDAEPITDQDFQDLVHFELTN